MKNKLILLCLGLLFISCKEVNEEQTKSKVEEVVSDVIPTYTSAKEALRYLSSDELEGRDTGSEGIDKAATFIENALKEFQIPPFFETYRDSFKLKELDGYNVVGIKKAETPSDLKPLVIGAHFDHIGHIDAVDNDSIANGANDNASGTVAVLELARFLSDKTLKRDVIFALFSAEERGLVGSRHLANKLKSAEVEPYLVFNIEMLGVQMKDKNYKTYITGYEISNLAEVFNGFYDEELMGYLPKANEFNLFKRSDNYPFFEVFNIPAHTICTFDFTNFDYYHHVKDEFEELEVDAYVELVDELKPGVLKLINSTEIQVKLN